MTETYDVPQSLRRAFRGWDREGRPTQQPSGWRRATWQRWIENGQLPETPVVGRAEAEAAARVAADSDEQAITAFVTAMVWGYGPVGYGAWRTRRILDHSGDSAGPRLRAVAQAAQDGPAAAFAAMAAAPLPYLGPSFGTKYIYFCTSAVRDQHDGRTAPVLDEVVRRWLARHAGLQLAGSWSTRQYGLYLARLESWGAQLGVPSDQVEELIFRAQISQDGNRLWSEQFLVESDLQGEALAALDELHTTVDLLGAETSDAAENPLQQLRRLIEASTSPDGEPS